MTKAKRSSYAQSQKQNSETDRSLSDLLVERAPSTPHAWPTERAMASPWRGEDDMTNVPCVPSPLWLEEKQRGLTSSNSQYPFKNKIWSIAAGNLTEGPPELSQPSNQPCAEIPAPHVKGPPLTSMTHRPGPKGLTEPHRS